MGSAVKYSSSGSDLVRMAVTITMLGLVLMAGWAHGSWQDNVRPKMFVQLGEHFLLNTLSIFLTFVDPSLFLKTSKTQPLAHLKHCTI